MVSSKLIFSMNRYSFHHQFAISLWLPVSSIHEQVVRGLQLEPLSKEYKDAFHDHYAAVVLMVIIS